MTFYQTLLCYVRQELEIINNYREAPAVTVPQYGDPFYSPAQFINEISFVT